MAAINQIVVACIGIMCIFFFAASAFTDANRINSGNTMDFVSLNKTQAYGSYMQNQTTAIKQKIQSSQAQGAGIDVGTALWTALNAAALAASGFFAFFDIALAFVSDAGGYLQIPLFFISMALVYLIFKSAVGVYNALRGGHV
jgi:hypothetical protein